MSVPAAFAGEAVGRGRGAWDGGAGLLRLVVVIVGL